MGYNHNDSLSVLTGEWGMEHGMVEWLKNLPDMFHVLVSDFGITDLLDIIIVAWIFYLIMTRLRTTSAARVAKGIVVLLVVTGLSGLVGLDMLRYLLGTTIEMGFLALVIVFQPELRRLLERFGTSSSIKSLFAREQPTAELERAIRETVAACETMSADRTGALIVFERKENLGEYFKTGTVVDAKVSAELLKNIFFVKAALHDGAVIIRDARVAAAGCVLPLTNNPNLSRDLGTRHRAGIGMSESSDAVVVIVSEETGTISVACRGTLRRHLAGPTLEKILREELLPREDELPARKVRRLIDSWQEKKDEEKANSK